MRELSLEKESLEDVFVSLIRNGDEQDALAEPAPVVVR
jgi:hypothetical protein